ncbi:ribosome recycling factor [Candidatus Margulisiibacteriota bacterium]
MSDVKNENMEKSVDSFKRQLASIRTGRANPEMLSRIQVDYYGSTVPLKQVATVTVPESTCFLLHIFDKNALKSVEKALQTSDLGVNPQVEGTAIRIKLPDLTEERRKEYIKLVKKYAEDAKVSLRNIRRDYLDHIKKQEKNKELTTDDVKTEEAAIQKAIEKYSHQIDEVAKEKEKEIMHV